MNSPRSEAPPIDRAARLRQRTGSPTGSLSDADERVAAAMTADTDPWPEATVVRTDRTPDRSAQVALSTLDSRRNALSSVDRSS